MKSTTVRFKVSVLMKVLMHRHHPSSELRIQQSVIDHKLVVTPSCSYKESKQSRKQVQNWLSSEYATSEHLENSSGSAQFYYSDDFFTN